MTYILSLAAAALAAALVELLAPKGSGGRLASGVRMTAGIFLLVALITPLRAGLDLLTHLSDGDLELPAVAVPDYESTFQDALLSLGESELTVHVTEILQSEFDIPPDLVSVVPVWRDSGEVPPPLHELCVVLSGKAMLENPHPIEAYFTDTLGVPCRVSVSP